MAYPMERTHLPNAAKAIAVVERNERQASSMEEPQLEITFWWRRILVYWIGLVILLTTFPWVVGPPYWEGVVCICVMPWSPPTKRCPAAVPWCANSMRRTERFSKHQLDPTSQMKT